MFYIVGLGNPGEKYERTRHNIGWLALDYLIEQEGLPALVESGKYAGRISEGVLCGEDVDILYPDTYMNKSGSAVQKLVSKDAVKNLIVVHDEVDLPVGEVKISVNRGDGGHNGISSIINSMGSKEFIRIRLGISPTSFWTKKVKRPQGAALPKHVLGNFTTWEDKHLERQFELTRDIIKTILRDGVEAAMNRFN